MGLFENLEAWKARGKPIGFSPWLDADGMLWGIVLAFTKKSVTVVEISPFGEPEGEATYRLGSISYWDADPRYSERLVRLSGFARTRPDKKSFKTKRSEIRRMLSEAAETGEVVTVQLRSQSWRRTATVTFCDSDWVGLKFYDALMWVTEREIWRVSTVEKIQWRTAREESEEYLARHTATQ